MVSGSSLLVQIQIAFIGIVVVGCMFFMWRALARLEERVLRIELDCPGVSKSGTHVHGSNCYHPDYMGDMGASYGTGEGGASMYPDEDEYAEEMMKVFGGKGGMGDSITLFSVQSDVIDPFAEPSSVTLTEMTEVTDVTETGASATIQEDSDVDTTARTAGEPDFVPASFSPAEIADNFSEAETENENPLSKSKLKRMNADKLKDICRERGLSNEGSKATLIDRILGITRD